MPQGIQAIYRDETIEEFQGNPLIESLPEPFEQDQAIMRLMIRPAYSEWDRQRPARERRILTQRMAQFHQPSIQELDLYGAFDRCLRWGYEDRSPFSREQIRQVNRGYEAAKEDGSLNYFGGYHAHTYGFSLLGVSGLGKTTTIEGILHQFPQVIQHSSYHGLPLALTQIVWLKIDTPCDGSLKGLCKNFFKELDLLVDTSYFTQYSRSHTTVDDMMIAISRLTKTFHIGAIILDEINHLCSAKDDVPEKVMNFLVSLVNTSGVPVIMIGTPKALRILQKDFQQAKRGCGQGDFLWERMSNDPNWLRFCKALWRYQYTEKTVELTDELLNVMYEETQGIPFLAVHLYKLVQEQAILSGKEAFDKKDIQKTASQKMGLTKPMRKALGSGKDVDLKQFIDITPFTDQDYLDHCSIAPEKDMIIEPPKSNRSAADEAIQTLIGMGISYSSARELVTAALLENPKLKVPTEIAPAAYRILISRPKEPTEEVPFAGLTGYDALNQAGAIETASI